ncbi:MAG TPA: phosphoribosylformylglycinamidine cyclo-ligase [Phycisphaerae bacterium]|jgi:phosphoribosylformylglycinamidine cyclo-ligase|nr:phosphoribosylformylglycinamidine cyclo-ligase [Phycisphaerae bacterium]HOB73505.1 phosphoribosylformylglycinamidine cyclo-ligase [Phycisphaerae bacterium]HOJ54113.1 phosphoribosylformylglycinamidine cyclo-ligase [Phycisphaerae bacterium]HOL25594.1 phosphoribosylformylglycinamidine cyclo-ligase [Phycisphaerae bacterium]HPP20973.1 phosphoribosylformylglycinamidine cyclo-ligase [Phycisphaerae bacterium]
MARQRRTITYKDAGVDITANDRMVDLIKPIVRATHGPRVLGKHGGFAGLFRLGGKGLAGRGYKDPVLVGCTDGVGSKILLAHQAGRYDTIGIDLVAMNVNDMLTGGAEPLFFLDYIACHKLVPEWIAEVVKGIAAGCKDAGCALIGGETAEMPDLYRPNDFDLAGFAVGVVERKAILDGSGVKAGDVLIGLASSGLHSNGYSLARRVVFKEAKLKYKSRVPGIKGTIGDEMLKPTRIYVKPVLKLLKNTRLKSAVQAMAHITGSGLPGNVPRVIPKGLTAVIDTGSWQPPAIFGLLESLGVPRREMFDVFNMGIGYVLVVRPKAQAAVLAHFRRSGVEALPIGQVVKGKGGVELR